MSADVMATCAAAHAGADNEPDQAMRLEREEPHSDWQVDHHPTVLEGMSTPTVKKSNGRY
jgi:hypothetical protein